MADQADLTEIQLRADSSKPMTDRLAGTSADFAASSANDTTTTASDPLAARRSIFQQCWWLDCVTGGQYEEVTVKNDGRTVGWLPYVVTRRWGFAISDMPLLTHTLGPLIDAGVGRPNTQLLNRFNIITELLQQLPKLAFFRQVLAPDNCEALAYQAFGCHVQCQFTFVADCSDIAAGWKEMRDKTRNLIRRSEEKNHVTLHSDVAELLRFYADNCGARSQINRYQTSAAQRLLHMCVTRGQGMAILARNQVSNKISAGIFVVWDRACMYYLMSTRPPTGSDNGAVSLLVWAAMKEAHQRGLKFDFDGVSSAGTFRFLSGFGGGVATRYMVRKFSAAYHAIDKLRALTYGNAKETFD